MPSSGWKLAIQVDRTKNTDYTIHNPMSKFTNNYKLNYKFSYETMK